MSVTSSTTIYKAKYLFRLDDIHPKMNWVNFERMKNIFDKYHVLPIIAVIPDNQDQSLMTGQERVDFWLYIKGLESAGWTIAMHGHTHQYANKNGGILGINNRGEFADISYDIQLEKIKKGKEILVSHGLVPQMFIAPAHSFDRNTCKALVAEGFKYISDGIALFPFKRYDLIWIPQIAWKPRRFFTGIITTCFHTDTCTERDFVQLEQFLKESSDKNITVPEALDSVRTGSFLDGVLRIVFYGKRNLLRFYKKIKTI